MWQYQAPLREISFVINEWLEAPQDWRAMPAFETLDPELAEQIINEAARFATGILAPLNASGDRQGCQFNHGEVSTPTGFADAYSAYREAGWPTIACAKEDGGQGLPMLLVAVLMEMIYSSNHAWAMYPGIAHGAYKCLKAHAPAWMKDRYLEAIVSGEILPTMCLTEPQAGSDLGLINSRAKPENDGSYRLSGSKIFISGGEHDLTDNILHLVLARLPDAPQGVAGISLFIVPKLLPDGRKNHVDCTGIEHKLGIRGSSTCSLDFDAAEAWLLGEPHQGLSAMFVMINTARLHIGLQGLAHTESAWQIASAYAVDRRQMRSIKTPQNVPSTKADPIQFHPAIRQKLMRLRTMSEGMRMLGYWTAHLDDKSKHSTELSQRIQADNWVMLLTPMIKAYFSEQGFQLASSALQVLGGHGYIQENAIEQTLRDSRIAMIYEGTNEIQANDLLMRKVLRDRGAALRSLLKYYQEAAVSFPGTDGCQLFSIALEKACSQLADLSDQLISVSAKDPEQVYLAAGDFLQVFGLVSLAFVWTRSSGIACTRTDDAFYSRKYESAVYFFDYILPELDYRLAIIKSGNPSLPFL